MTRYVLTEKIAKGLIAREYKLVCKISQCPLQIGLSEREAKQKDVNAKCPICKTVDSEDVKFYWRCKKCGYEWPPLNMGEVVESKQQRGGRSKLYSAKNYDNAHILSTISDEEIDKSLDSGIADKKWNRGG